MGLLMWTLSFKLVWKVVFKFLVHTYVMVSSYLMRTIWTKIEWSWHDIRWHRLALKRWNNVTTYWSDLTKQNCADKRKSKLSFIRDKTFLATVPLSKWHSALVLMYHQERGYIVNHNHILLIFRRIILSEIFFVIYQKIFFRKSALQAIYMALLDQ